MSKKSGGRTRDQLVARALGPTEAPPPNKDAAPISKQEKFLAVVEEADCRRAHVFCHLVQVLVSPGNG